MPLEAQKTIDSKSTTNQVYLYVEGQDDSIDPAVIKELFSDVGNITVRPIGSCNYVQGASEVLQCHEPNHFFLVDRDHHRTGEELNWAHFESGKTNFIVWKRKELENYFIDPEFLQHTKLSTIDDAAERLKKIQDEVLGFSQKRLYLDIANYVVVSIREGMKESWIEIFGKMEQFPDYHSSLGLLKSISGFAKIKKIADRLSSSTHLEELFKKFYQEMTDDNGQLRYGTGKWLDMISGKSVYHFLLNNSGLFPNEYNGEQWSGKTKTNDIAKQLLRNTPKERWPLDFQELRDLIITRAKPVISQRK